MGELMICDDDMLIYLGDSVDIIKHTTQNRIITNLQQWLWEVFCQLAQACGVACCYYYILHFVN